MSTQLTLNFTRRHLFVPDFEDFLEPSDEENLLSGWVDVSLVPSAKPAIFFWGCEENRFSRNGVVVVLGDDFFASDAYLSGCALSDGFPCVWVDDSTYAWLAFEEQFLNQIRAHKYEQKVDFLVLGL